MKKALSGALTLGLVLAAAAPALADDVPGIYATGIDDAGMTLPPGSIDPHWDVIAVPAGSRFSAPGDAIVASPHPSFVANDPVNGPGSRWIGTTGSLRDAVPAGDYVYRTTFDLTGFDPATAVLSGRFLVDNTVVDVVVNGTSLGHFGGQFRTWKDLTLDTGFVAGTNTLDFVVSNLGFDPSGLRVELAGTADPLPTAITVDLDVRPFSDGNVVNPWSMGKLPVAVLSTPAFDAATIDPSSVRLSGARAACCKDGRPMRFVRDVDDDGDDDLILFFTPRDLDVSGDPAVVSLTGTTADGTDVEGTDVVNLAECVHPRDLAAAFLGRWAERGWHGHRVPMRRGWTRHGRER